MNIQFPCKSCGKYIEVDGEWANRLVQCPYCSSTVTAPESSESKPELAEDGPQIPPVTPEVSSNTSAGFPGPGMPAHWGDNGVVYGQTQPQPRKVLPWVGLGLACLGLIAGIIFFFLGALEMFSHIDKTSNPDEFGEFFEKAVEAKEGWAIKASLWLFLGVVVGGLLWCAGLVCGIVSLARTKRCVGGWLTLGVCGLPLVLLVVAVVLGLINGA